ncbi:MAG: hypothetical protein WB869_09480, partial [Candidatus Acidiferrales bacterium]
MALWNPTQRRAIEFSATVHEMLLGDGREENLHMVLARADLRGERRMAGLPTGVQALLRDPDNEHHLSTASLWEIAIKSRLGKLRLRPSLNA